MNKGGFDILFHTRVCNDHVNPTPKSTHHRKLSVFSYFEGKKKKKKVYLLVFFYKLFSSWGSKKCCGQWVQKVKN